jgi:hypothetical protein
MHKVQTSYISPPKPKVEMIYALHLLMSPYWTLVLGYLQVK